MKNNSMPLARDRGLSIKDVLPLERLPEDGLRFDESLEAHWLAEQLLQGLPKDLPRDLAARVVSEVQVGLTVNPLGPVLSVPPIEIRGQVSVSIRTSCVRCLEEVPLELKLPLNQALLPTDKPTESARGLAERQQGKDGEKKGRGPPRVEQERADQDDDAESPEFSYDPRGIDLLGLVRETLLLEIPLNPSCLDEAACDQRTARLIADANRPAEEAMVDEDARWADLKKVLETKRD